MTLTTSSQWLFPVSALSQTPSVRCAGVSVQKELYDRSRGIEFLYRLGSTLLLLVPHDRRHAASRLTPFPQLPFHDDNGCHLVPPVLHEVFDRRLSQTGLAPSIISTFASQHTCSCRKSLLPPYFSQQRQKSVAENYVMSPACLQRSWATRICPILPLRARWANRALGTFPFSYPRIGDREHSEYHPRVRRGPVRSTLFRFLGGKCPRASH